LTELLKTLGDLKKEGSDCRAEAFKCFDSDNIINDMVKIHQKVKDKNSVIL